MFKPDSDRLIELGYAKVAHVPVLFDNEGRYCRVHNRYLRERALAEWSPNHDGIALAAIDLPRPKTIEAAARHLGVFIDWCDAKQKDWRNIDYIDDVLDFQNHMAKGTWSLSGRRLKSDTANIRTDEVTSFLTWAATRGLRSPFSMKLKSAAAFARTGFSSQKFTSARSRPGRLRPSPTASEMVTMLPPAQAVRDWLSLLREQRGYAKYLACRFILETGVRREELVSIKVDQIPSREALEALANEGQIFGYIQLTETKGGRPRRIQVALKFLLEIRRWIDGPRMRLPRDWSRRNGNRTPSKSLFLSDARQSAGTPISAATVYRCFKLKPHPPKWHPHFGRHVYACFTVIHTLEAEASMSGRSLSEMGADWIQSRGLWCLQTLRSQLGHLSEDTTNLYLRWLTTHAGMARYAAGWHHFLAGDDSEGSSA
jgi:integrase